MVGVDVMRPVIRGEIIGKGEASWRALTRGALAGGLRHCPVLTAVLAMLLMGAGMLLAVGSTVLALSAPLGLLLGWF